MSRVTGEKASPVPIRGGGLAEAGWTRRQFFIGAAAAVGAGFARPVTRAPQPVVLVLAPSNLGLRPPGNGEEPGVWRAPEALVAAGLASRLGIRDERRLERPRYEHEAQRGTRIRNGRTIRSFSERLADEVASSLRSGAFPLVLGGDCSVLLGCLLGARRSGLRGLVHVDGHSDFFHPGNYDTSKQLGSAAGMDLALVTGRGEKLLTEWPGVIGPLAADLDTVQVGERDSEDPQFAATYGDIVSTPIARLVIQQFKRQGSDESARWVVECLGQRGLERVWLHVDFDVLDEAVMPAVDSPGSPGMTFDELATFVRALLRSGRIHGADFAIFDPDLDPTGRHARGIVDCLAEAFETAGGRRRNSASVLPQHPRCEEEHS